jgi:hypothetical protein
MAAFSVRRSRNLFGEAGHRAPMYVRVRTNPSSSYPPRPGWPKPPAPAAPSIPLIFNARSEQGKRKERYSTLLFCRETPTRFRSAPSSAASRLTKGVPATSPPRPHDHARERGLTGAAVRPRGRASAARNSWALQHSRFVQILLQKSKTARCYSASGKRDRHNFLCSRLGSL